MRLHRVDSIASPGIEAYKDTNGIPRGSKTEMYDTTMLAVLYHTIPEYPILLTKIPIITSKAHKIAQSTLCRQTVDPAADINYLYTWCIRNPTP